eukprot:TRINITY_DN1331_c0_g1_i1.p1 TRINITY_DN1331_c0_g1~~TRINITY_DN1331_c0_g1_i1.p1  ORF type:complete len:1071 (+),score=223.00 TRINITY_DN1331_c0_g1_i1:78-3215(+)
MARRTTGGQPRGKQHAIKGDPNRLVAKWMAQLLPVNEAQSLEKAGAEGEDAAETDSEKARSMIRRQAGGGLATEGFDTGSMPDLSVQAKAAQALRLMRQPQTRLQHIPLRHPTPPAPRTDIHVRGALSPRPPLPLSPTASGVRVESPPQVQVTPALAHPDPPPEAAARRRSRRSSGVSTRVSVNSDKPLRTGTFAHGPGDRRRCGLPKQTLRQDIELTQARITRCRSGGSAEDLAALDRELMQLLSTNRTGKMLQKAPPRRRQPPPPPSRATTPTALLVLSPGLRFGGLFRRDATRALQWVLGPMRMRRTSVGAWRIERSDNCYVEANAAHEGRLPHEVSAWDRWDGPACEWVAEPGITVRAGRLRGSRPPEVYEVRNTRAGLDGTYKLSVREFDCMPVWECGHMQLCSRDGYWMLDDSRRQCVETRAALRSGAPISGHCPPENAKWDLWCGLTQSWIPAEVTVQGVAVETCEPLPDINPSWVGSEVRLTPVGSPHAPAPSQAAAAAGDGPPSVQFHAHRASTVCSGSTTFITHVPTPPSPRFHLPTPRHNPSARSSPRSAQHGGDAGAWSQRASGGSHLHTLAPAPALPPALARASRPAPLTLAEGPERCATPAESPQGPSPGGGGGGSGTRPDSSADRLIANLPPVRMKPISIDDVRAGRLVRAPRRFDRRKDDGVSDVLSGGADDLDKEAAKMVENLLFNFHSNMKVNEAKRVLGLVYRRDSTKSTLPDAEDFQAFARAYCWEHLQFHVRCTQELRRVGKERFVLFPHKRDILNGILANTEVAKQRNPRWREARENLHMQVFKDVQGEFRDRRRHLLQLWFENFKRALPAVLTPDCRRLIAHLDAVFAGDAQLDQRAFFDMSMTLLRPSHFLLDDVLSLLWAIKIVFQVGDEEFCDHVRKRTLKLWPTQLDFRAPRGPQVDRKLRSPSTAHGHNAFLRTMSSMPKAAEDALSVGLPSPCSEQHGGAPSPTPRSPCVSAACHAAGFTHGSAAAPPTPTAPQASIRCLATTDGASAASAARSPPEQGEGGGAPRPRRRSNSVRR